MNFLTKSKGSLLLENFELFLLKYIFPLFLLFSYILDNHRYLLKYSLLNLSYNEQQGFPYNRVFFQLVKI